MRAKSLMENRLKSRIVPNPPAKPYAHPLRGYFMDASHIRGKAGGSRQRRPGDPGFPKAG
jgi:hypothetical protein